MNITIRTANSQDLTQYTDLLQTTYQQAYTNESLGLTADCFSKKIFASADTQKYLQSHLVNTGIQKTWLAFDGKKLVGSVTCVLRNDIEADLTGFYVRSNYQGQTLGKKLYHIALDFAGDRDVLLDIYTHNTKAVNMYQKWGWQLDDSRGEGGYFYRHWPEWPAGVQAKCMYMRLKGQHE